MQWDVIIIGGSYAGMSAAMSLGRSLRKVLIIDSGEPCNAPTPHSHNFLTQDGKTPAAIAQTAREQLLLYTTVKSVSGLVNKARPLANGFEVETTDSTIHTSKKIILASGIKDILPDIKGLKDCWGKSVIHCPYCHGYEVKNEPTGIIANKDIAAHLAPLIHNLTQQLSIFTNGPVDFTEVQLQKFRQHDIQIVETPVQQIQQQDGQVEKVILADGKTVPLKAVYYRPAFTQSFAAHEQLGCQLDDHGYIQVDGMQQTTVPGVFACGDNSNKMRSVAGAVFSGSFAGASANAQLASEQF